MYIYKFLGCEVVEPLNQEKMFSLAEEIGVKKVSKSSLTSLLLAISAGGFIAIAFIFYTTVVTGASELPWGVSRFLGGAAFSLGLIMVVLCGGDLFTSTVLTTIAKANKKITFGKMCKNWSVVYLGNMIGASLFVLLIWTAQTHMNASGAWGVTALNIAQHKIHHTFGQAVALGILCNVLVCMAVWMTYACRSVTDKILVLILPVAMFVATGFEHSVANMFMIPLGVVIQNFASPEFWSSVQSNAEYYSDLTVQNYVVKNLIPVTIGNIIGGGFLVGLGYFWIERTKSN